eukprot:364940-Chlamydomonas_euryale.AAC.3
MDVNMLAVACACMRAWAHGLCGGCGCACMGVNMLAVACACMRVRRMGSAEALDAHAWTCAHECMRAYRGAWACVHACMCVCYMHARTRACMHGVVCVCVHAWRHGLKHA